MSDMRRMMMMFTRPVESSSDTVPNPTISPSAGAILPTQTISISISGIATSAEYSFDNQTWTTYSSPFTLSSATTVYARATDGSGNYSNIVSNAYTLLYDAQVEYLQSNGSQWINAGIKPTNTLSFSCTFDNPNNSGAANGYGNVFGSRISSGKHEYQLTKYGSGSVSVGTRNTGKGFNTSGIHTVTFDGGTTITVDGTTSTITKSSIQSNIGNIVLFGISQGTSTGATQLQAGKIYSCSFGSVRDFIPVRKDGVGYMYDRVSGELFGNNGSGSFTFGNDVTT